MNTNYTYLNKINSSVDLKKIPKTELNIVCEELRHFIIEQVSQHPGHLGSNLGTVELTDRKSVV